MDYIAVATQILNQINGTYMPYDAMYDMCLGIYRVLGYTNMVDFEYVYQILEDNIPVLLANRNKGKIDSFNANRIWIGSQTEYDALQFHDNKVLYVIPDAE